MAKDQVARYPPERQRAIAELLLASSTHRATVSLISERLEVTTETVRRDLDVLERRGLLRRIRGGAELVTSTPFEAALAARHAEQYQDKLAIAQHVVAGLPDDGVIVLDSGSLTLFCAAAMTAPHPMVVVTNNLPAAQLLVAHEHLTVMLLPGMVRGLTSASVDASTTRRLAGLTVDVAIIGMNGLSTARGLTTTSPEEAATKRSMLLSARRRVAPVISGKLGRNSFCPFAAINEVDLIVTDAGADPDLLAQLAEAGPDVQTADPVAG